MHKPLVLLLFIFLCPQFLSAQGLEWVKRFGNTDYREQCNDLTVDIAGNILSTGHFFGTVDFDPGPGSSPLSAAVGNDIFIQKLSPNGELIWVKKIGGTAGETAQEIALDITGNIYITGSFAGTSDFDPGPGVSNLVSSANGSAFVLKLNQNGSFLWAKEVDGGPSSANALAVDPSGIAYITGDFSGTSDFDPGPGEFLMSNTGTGGSDIFVLKLNANGDFEWAKKMGAEAYDEGNNIHVCPDGNIVVTGSFNRTVDFDPNAGVFNVTSNNNNQEDVFIEKFDPAGNMLWVRQLGSYERDLTPSSTVDRWGNIITTGLFYIPTDFDPGPGVVLLDPIGFSGLYIQKLDANGNYVWAKVVGTASNGGICTDLEGNVFIHGIFRGVSDFDPGSGTADLISAGLTNADAMILKLDSSGNYVWAERMGGNSSDVGYAIHVDTLGQIYATGTFQSTADLDPGLGVNYLVSTGNTDFYILKMGQNWNFYGTVFYDRNGNQKQDPEDRGIPGVMLQVGNLPQYASTDTSGHYRLNANIIGETLYPIKSYSYWNFTPTSAKPDSAQHAMDFAVNFDSGIQDIGVTLVQISPLRPGFESEYWVYVRNYLPYVTDSFTLNLKFSTDPLQLISADPWPTSVTTELLSWHLDSMAPFETKVFKVSLKMIENIPIGDLVSILAVVRMDSDAFLSNNTDVLRVTVQGSYDPNDKRVFPTQVTPDQLDTTRLSYVVRFQNTGNFPAEFVVIRDTLPAGLEITSFEILGASHPFTWRIYDQGILEVRFDPIFLPDSTSNEPESHGFVAFSALPNKNLALGDSVQNRVGIYFDFNEPVLTNYAVMKVEIVSGLKEPGEQLLIEINLIPNPAKAGTQVFIGLPASENSQESVVLLLYDAQGRQLRRLLSTDSRPKLDLAGLAPGVYFVQAITSKGIGIKELIIR